jgi:hypothetical protein
MVDADGERLFITTADIRNARLFVDILKKQVASAVFS